jgi:predicted kinase
MDRDTSPPQKNDSTLRNDAPSGQAAPRVHLVLGPVGAGKSTYALTISGKTGAIRLTLDEWMTRLFSPDRPREDVVPWYAERAARCVDQIWSVATAVVDSGASVVLELGLLSRAERRAFYARADGYPLTVHVLDAPREVRRRRVEERNRSRGATFSMVVPSVVFELASDLWEPPDALECEGRDVRFVSGEERR